MKMRKYFVMALVALGATAAFSSCQKDDKGGAALGPEISLYNSDNTVRIAAKQSDVIKDKEFIVRVTLAKDVKLESLRWNFSYAKADGSTTSQFEKGKEEKLSTKTNPTTQVEEVRFNKELPSSKGTITFIAKDKNGKVTELTRVVDLDGKSGGETPTIAVEAKAWVNNNQGAANGGFSLTAKKSVPSADKTADLVNESEATKGISAKLKSNTEMLFAHVESAEIDYSKATKELVAKAAVGKTFTATIDGLKANSLFIAKDKTGTTFYLFKVTEIGANDKDYDGTKAVPTKSTNGNGGYVIFGYKSNK